ncbi:DoxX family protein [Limisphaera sp. VF-2]|jgi:uncharacterized membrane protein YphA (DoxX/SURF4 family)|uniref:DoxX family protein n=1 Tax=Limisphaera sp. VF-2 TaxID=3400418 RepID=UPI001779E3E4|nr:DoxX family membrane protein [Limisphaera sp.]
MNRSVSKAEWLGLVLRWALGAWMLSMGLVKAWDPVAFLKAVRQYELVSAPWLLNTVAIAVPWLEVFCGLLMVTGVAVRGTAWLLTAMLVPFTWLVWRHAWILQASLQIPFCAVKFDCGCGLGEVYICPKLAENLVLTAAAVWVGWTGRGRPLALRYDLVRGRFAAGPETG